MTRTRTRKYELVVDDLSFAEGKVLWRIRALRGFGHVSAGEYGGYVEDEENLSHEGSCWVYDNAQIYNGGKVRGSAIATGNSVVCDNAELNGLAHVRNNSKISRNSIIWGVPAGIIKGVY